MFISKSLLVGVVKLMASSTSPLPPASSVVSDGADTGGTPLPSGPRVAQQVPFQVCELRAY